MDFKNNSVWLMTNQTNTLSGPPPLERLANKNRLMGLSLSYKKMIHLSTKVSLNCPTLVPMFEVFVFFDPHRHHYLFDLSANHPISIFN